jgi:hypothetical protein
MGTSVWAMRRIKSIRQRIADSNSRLTASTIKKGKFRMRNLGATLFLVTAMISTAAPASAADNSVGTWKLNMDKSKFTPAAPMKALTSTREAADGGIKVTTTGELADGGAINSSYTAKYDGKEAHVSGNSPYDTIAIKQVNANTFTATTRKSGGKYRGTGRTLVSKDGKTLTTTTRGTGADGKPFSFTLVYDKQ